MARAWWNDDWQFRKELTFDLSPSGANITEPLSNVPVLVRLSLGNFTYFNDVKPDGADLRFIAGDDKTPLKFHIEKFDPVAQMAFLWVTVPRLSGGQKTDKIYLYYGNPDAENAADSGGSYDPAQSLVYHFGPPAGETQDATAYKNEPTEFTAQVNVTSLIGEGISLDGTNRLRIAATPTLGLDPAKGLTMMMWLRIEAAQSGTIAQMRGAAGGVKLFVDDDRLVAELDTSTKTVRAAASSAVPVSQWVHVALRIDRSSLQLFQNGEQVANAAVSPSEMDGEWIVGADGAAAGIRVDIDELTVAASARTPGYIQAASRSQGIVAPLLVSGADAQKDGGGGESYFATTLRNVTIDGWVVIVLCILLLVASLAIMVGKFIFLNAVVRGNSKFLDAFRKLGDDPTQLIKATGNGDDASAFEAGGESELVAALASRKSPFGVSTLSRLYRHGINETNKRLAGQAAGAARVESLSPQSIEAIRATMDASLTRMTQRLSQNMVWLTIAIAGGPFLGLLGTVIGVMITFAAIAQAGDVNVNAIAPGTAAALAATVAGLGVAIPCLFGYNYLNTRIKNVVADMRVFVDEFVTRIAETYS
ncbi:MAG: DUF2341 domain-containing protein [Steroidobacteraceae bacterium]